MSPRAVATMAVRLIAVYALIPFVRSLGSLLTLLPQTSQIPGPSLFIMADAASSGVMLGLIIALWLLSVPLGRAIAPGDEAGATSGLDLRSLSSVGFGIIGIVLVVFALSGAALGLALATPADISAYTGVAQEGRGYLWSGLVELVLGLLVFVGRSGLGRVLSAARRY